VISDPQKDGENSRSTFSVGNPAYLLGAQCRERIILLLLLTSGEPVNPRSTVTRDPRFYLRERERERGRERERQNALPVTGGIKIHALLTRGRFVDPDG